MRILADRSSHKLTLFGDLVSECQLSAPGYRLSDKLRRKMEEFGREDRREVACQKTTEGCAPLFLACRNGSADVVDYLLNTCGADIEQRGQFEVQIHHRIVSLSQILFASSALEQSMEQRFESTLCHSNILDFTSGTTIKETEQTYM